MPKSAILSVSNTCDKAILKYGHGVVWLLLALACVVARFNLLVLAKTIALIGLLVYLMFQFTIAKLKSPVKKPELS
ncbi:MAG: hypothetical protein ABI761_17510 [Saprospiraceae bacterium]